MSIFNVLSMIGGLCLFLFGMSIMGEALERRAGNSLKGVLAKMTTNRFAGFLTGCAVTAVIQSSSATTVMVVGFVNSGLMNLRQAINVIMGANVGTTITSWILSLSGINSSNVWIRLLKPSSFTPVLALVGIILFMFCKKSPKKDVGIILLGFATLMFGMETMSSSVSVLADVPEFQQLFIMFKNPFLGLLVGAVLTGIIQSSSASVGILQALAITGQVSIGAAIPIIMGQNIGTCVTALISSIGANKNAKRTAFVHLIFNVAGSIAVLIFFCIWKYGFNPAVLDTPANAFGIAVFHTIFNFLCVLILMPNAKLLEKLAVTVIKDNNNSSQEKEILDERLLHTPTLALQQCYSVAMKMARYSVRAINKSIDCITKYSESDADQIRKDEEKCDKLEDAIGTYLVALSSMKLGDKESEQAASLLKMIGDLERISDHAVNVLYASQELRSKGYSFTEDAVRELEVLTDATKEIIEITFNALDKGDIDAASKIQPLEQVIDIIKEKLRTHHIKRMQQGLCTIEAGFVWSDLLTDLERVSDHCSNIAGCLIETSHHNLSIHENQRNIAESNDNYVDLFYQYKTKYSVK